MSVDASLDDLLAERARACRLTPDRALQTVEEAALFLTDRGVLTRTPDCSLPSLFEACHEEPYRAGGHGFAAWPKTKYSWAGELEERPEYLVLKIHRGKNLLLAGAPIAMVAPICLAELARMERADPGWNRLLRHLAEAGPSTLEDLQQELGLRPAELRSLRHPLERCGALVARQRVEPAGVEAGGHVHTSELARFDQVLPCFEHASSESEGDAGAGDAARRAFEDLVVAGLRAAVVAREDEIAKWFSWRWLYDTGFVDRLVSAGRARRLAGGFLAPRLTVDRR